MSVNVNELIVVQADCDVLRSEFNKILNQATTLEEVYLIRKHLLLLVDSLEQLDEMINAIYKEHHSSRRISEGEQ